MARWSRPGLWPSRRLSLWRPRQRPCRSGRRSPASRSRRRPRPDGIRDAGRWRGDLRHPTLTLANCQIRSPRYSRGLFVWAAFCARPIGTRLNSNFFNAPLRPGADRNRRRRGGPGRHSRGLPEQQVRDDGKSGLLVDHPARPAADPIGEPAINHAIV